MYKLLTDGDKKIFQSTLPARGATWAVNQMQAGELFQSTLPARGATAIDPEDIKAAIISIHTPREGSDGLSRIPRTADLEHFNPHSPRGERPQKELRSMLGQ